jgi:hypothetical protein
MIFLASKQIERILLEKFKRYHKNWQKSPLVLLFIPLQKTMYLRRMEILQDLVVVHPCP